MAKYKMDGDFSVGNYCGVVTSSPQIDKLVYMRQWLMHAIDKCNTILPKVISTTTISSNYLVRLSDNMGEEREEMCDEFVSSYLCCNASTNKYHVEKDASSTLIFVPDQDYDKKWGPMRFNFMLNMGRYIHFDMLPGTIFLYSSYYISHRQTGGPALGRNGGSFFNFAAYTNPRLIRNARKSRVKLSKK